MVEGLLCVASDERLHEGSLADTGRADDGDDGGRGLIIWGAVDEGDMEASLIAFSSTTALPVCIATGPGSEGLEDHMRNE